MNDRDKTETDQGDCVRSVQGDGERSVGISGCGPELPCAETGPNSPSSPESFPIAARALARLLVAFDGWRAELRKRAALAALAKAVRLSPDHVAQLALSCAVAAAFTLHKDGQEYGVFIGGKRVTVEGIEEAA